MIKLIFYGGPNCALCAALKPKLTSMLVNYPYVEYSEIDSTQKPEMAAQNMVYALPVVQISVDHKEY